MNKTTLNKKSLYAVKYGLYRMMDICKIINMIISDKELENFRSMLSLNANISSSSYPYQGILNSKICYPGYPGIDGAINSVVSQLNTNLKGFNVTDFSIEANTSSPYEIPTINISGNIV